MTDAGRLCNPGGTLGTMWEPAEIAHLAAEALAARDRDLTAEHAVYGLDSLDELGLHPLLAAGLGTSGFGVWREHPYPGRVESRAKRSERERCDLVLTLDPGLPPIDPVAELKHLDALAGTLFAPVAESMATAERFTEVGDAYWVEVKTVSQFAFSAGVPGPNKSYAAELVGGVTRDAVKLASEPMVRYGAVLLVLFTADDATAEHDLAIAAHRCLDKGAPIGSPAWASVPIEDRVGNALCTVAVMPVRL